MLNLPPADRLLDVPDPDAPPSTPCGVPPAPPALDISRNGDSHADDPLPGNEEPDWEQSTKEKPDKLPEIYDIFEFIEQKLIRPPELIGGLLHQGTKMLVGGGSKSFKTWIQLHMALSVASGVDWLGCPVARGRVLFANFEIGPSFFQDRINQVAEAMGIKIEKGMMDVWNLRGFGASYDVVIPEIIRRTRDKSYSLDVLDPIYKLYGTKMADENSTGQVAQLLNQIESMCVETGAAASFGAHFSKGNQSQKESIDRTSGSGVWGRDPDTILTFTRHEEDDCFVVEPTLRNLPPIKPFVVRWKFPLMVRDENLDPEKLRQVVGKTKEHDPVKLLTFLADSTPENQVTITMWSDRSKVARTTLNDYIRDFRLRQLIKTVGGGNNAYQILTEKGKELIKNYSR